MRTPTPADDGRVANEAGYYERDCPFPPGDARREKWLSDWNDAQVDREAWEGSNWHRAHVFGEGA